MDVRTFVQTAGPLSAILTHVRTFINEDDLPISRIVIDVHVLYLPDQTFRMSVFCFVSERLDPESSFLKCRERKLCRVFAIGYS